MMEVVRDGDAPVGAESLLVLLPGAYMRARDFVDHGFFDAVRRTGQAVDIVAVDTGMESYLDGVVVERLHEAVIGPARAGGVRRIWLAGISLGGLGALLYARAHTSLVEGLVLMSPFIGTRGAVAEVTKAGGFDRWEAGGSGIAASERHLLAWLQSYRSDGHALPETLIGYGKEDRFAASYRLLAELLPDENVLAITGGHDWETWKTLWKQLVLRLSFAPSAARPAR